MTPESNERPDREAFSIPEWCAAVGISRALFYKLPPDELPKVTKLGNRSLITRRANEDWQARVTQETET